MFPRWKWVPRGMSVQFAFPQQYLSYLHSLHYMEGLSDVSELQPDCLAEALSWDLIILLNW